MEDVRMLRSSLLKGGEADLNVFTMNEIMFACD